VTTLRRTGMHRLLLVLLTGCTGQLAGTPLGASEDTAAGASPDQPGDDAFGEPANDGGAGKPGTGGHDDRPTKGAELPCDVESLLSTYCTGCHNGSPAGLAPMPLLTRADLLANAPSDAGISVGAMSLTRLHSSERPMPPGAQLPTELYAGFESWVKDGMKAESCNDDTGTPPLPFEAVSIYTATRQVKGLLTGLAPTEQEIASVSANAAALRDLIDVWMEQPEFELKMRAFFTKAFQQTELTPDSLLDQFGRRLAGDDAVIARLLSNLEESFARTAFDLVANGRPFNEAITTRTFMMTPALMSFLTVLDERPIDDQLRVSEPPISFTLRTTGTAIPLASSIDPTNANFMKFTAIGASTNCAQTSFTSTKYFDLHYLLMGRFFGPNTCRVSLPSVYTDEDFTDWRKVTVRAPAKGEKITHFYEMPKLRSTTELALNTPRIGFFSTPAFFANWSTNESNQMRVTANQSLIVALGASFDGSDNTVPVTDNGLAAEHAGPTTACYACHKTLDPMRQFFRSAFSLGYHEQRDPVQSALSGAFLFEGAEDQGRGLDVLAQGLASHERFASAWVQKLCYYASSARCGDDDPELVRIAGLFRTSGYDFKTLVRELFSSPLITASSGTQTFEERSPVVSITRQDHLCSALSLRLGISDVCGLGTNVVDPMRRAAQVVALSMPADGYSRGSEIPVVLSDTNLFFRAATEALCSVIGNSVVDAGANTKYRSASADLAIVDMVHNIMGLAVGDPLEAPALEILKGHHTAALAAGARPADALRSTFVLSCTAPSTVAIGL